MPHSTNYSYIITVCFNGGGNQEYKEKTTDLSQVSDKFYHISWSWTCANQ
jgi:hypothetical protein